MEPWVGGRFMEEWDGGSALYALVTHMVTNARLTISGPMGMRGARQYVKTYELSADGDTTVVRTSASMLGDIDDELLTGYRDGGEELLQAFKAYVETREPPDLDVRPSPSVRNPATRPPLPQPRCAPAWSAS